MDVLSVNVLLFQFSSNRGRLCTPPLFWYVPLPVEGTFPVMMAASIVSFAAVGMLFELAEKEALSFQLDERSVNASQATDAGGEAVTLVVL